MDAILDTTGWFKADLLHTYITVSSIVLVIYDYLLMVSSEARYVWQANWGIGKFLYLLSRYPILVFALTRVYVSLFHVMSETECHALYSLFGCIMFFAVMISEIILAVRVWALWHRRIWLTVLFACMGAASVTTVVIQNLTQAVSVHTTESLSYSACVYVMTSGKDYRTSIILYILLLGNGTGVVLLMAIVWSKSCYKGIPFSSMMYTFYKDGLVYFVALLALSVGNLIFGSIQGPQHANALLSVQSALHSVLSTRMLLNLRRSARTDLVSVNSILDPNASHERNSVSSLRFASGPNGHDDVA
ncbi:hypothetical protein AB1N83_006294 [Pleurotus pulmonarius]